MTSLVLVAGNLAATRSMISLSGCRLRLSKVAPGGLGSLRSLVKAMLRVLSRCSVSSARPLTTLCVPTLMTDDM